MHDSRPILEVFRPEKPNGAAMVILPDVVMVGYANSLTLFQALKTAEVPAELHVYQEGGHGFGFSLTPDNPASRWPDAFEAWLRRLKFI